MSPAILKPERYASAGLVALGRMVRLRAVKCCPGRRWLSLETRILMTAADKERLELADELRDLSLVVEDLGDGDIFHVADNLRAVAERIDSLAKRGGVVFHLDEWRAN